MKCPVENCPARFYACEDPDAAAYGNLVKLDGEVLIRADQIVTARDSNKRVCFFDESTRESRETIGQSVSVILCSTLQLAGMKKHKFGGATESWRLFYQPADANASTIEELDKYLNKRK